MTQNRNAANILRPHSLSLSLSLPVQPQFGSGAKIKSSRISPRSSIPENEMGREMCPQEFLAPVLSSFALVLFHDWQGGAGGANIDERSTPRIKHERILCLGTFLFVHKYRIVLFHA